MRHAGASDVVVRAWIDEQMLWLEVIDDGTGFDFNVMPSDRDSLGMVGMHERAERIGGQLIIDTMLGKGTSIKTSLPLEMALVDGER